MAGQHAQTPKEECFEAAVEELREHRDRMGKKTPEIDHQRAWTQNRDTGQWRPEARETTFGRIMGSLAKTVRIILGQQPAEPGRWPTGQPRFPDVTVNMDNGQKVVVDTKFDRPSGGRDSWNNNPGSVSGNDQRTDYNKMNEQQTGKKDQDLSLDADTCKCGEDPSPVEEMDPALAPAGQLYFTPIPGAAPLPSLPSLPPLPAPAPMPIPVLP
jgi:hypothetical protein